MDSRIGIGATSASAVIFSILLVSNFLVFTSSQDRQRLYSTANGENLLADDTTALVGAGATNVLIEAQEALSASALPCPNAVQSAAAAVGTLSDLQRSAHVVVAVSARVVETGYVPDSLSLLAPFNGSVPGDVDFSVSAAITGSGIAGIRFATTEAHALHLPVRIQRLAADCTAAFDGVAGVLSRAAGLNCTVGAVAPLVASSSHGPATIAASDGFSFAIQFTVAPNPSCNVGLQVTLEQAGIQGPWGTFTVRVAEAGTVSFGQAGSPQRP